MNDSDHTNGAKNGNGAIRLTNKELRRLFREQTQGESALVEDPLDSGLWPTAGLSDKQVDWLSDALGRVPRSALKKQKLASR